MVHHCQINKSHERKRNSNLFKCFMQESVLYLLSKKEGGEEEITLLCQRELLK